MNQVKELYDAAASRYDSMYNDNNAKLIEAENMFIYENLPTTGAKTILDCGSGTGLFVDLFKDDLWHCKYAGLDISKKMIDIAKKKHPEINFDVCDFMTYDESNKFDLVVSLFAVSDYCGVEGVQKMSRHLKKNGLMYLTFINKNGGYNALCHEQMNTDIETIKFTYKEIKDILKKMEYDWSYILGFSSLEYNDANGSFKFKDSVEAIYTDMEHKKHDLNNCKYYLLILQV